MMLVGQLEKPLVPQVNQGVHDAADKGLGLVGKDGVCSIRSGMRETRSCVRASALPKVKGLLVFDNLRGDLPLTLPDVP